MRAMVLKEICEVMVPGKTPQGRLPLKARPLELTELPVPRPGRGEVLVRVLACGICRTELDQIEGRISPPTLPVVPGHQPVGVVEALGEGVSRLKCGDLVGACWLYHACARCEFCQRGLENLCADFRATGCHADGGYAEYMVIAEDFAYKIPSTFSDPVLAAPLMCSGVVGYRSLKLIGMEDGKTLGFYGFGAANHLVIQMANFLYPHSRKFVFSRNPVERELALSLGADWAGGIDEKSPEPLDSAIDTTPAWQVVLQALGNLKKGGRLVLNLIRKEEADKQALLGLDYAKHLWWEKEIKTVANVTRKDALEFLELAARAKIKPEVQVYSLEEANEALVELKSGKIRGAKVLKIS